MATTEPTGSVLRAADVRKAYFEFFEARGHTFVPSSTTCPTDDPSLRDTFANAGMNQFKPAFLGQVEPGSPLEGITRAVNTQKCIRAGGKHNDLDDVGKDTYHHTFFEMLGNWSFGDYFKADAIQWAWELMTQVYGLDPERLYATYFGGDEAMGQGPDDEARELWLRYLPADRVLPGNAKDNFWEMGETGPCGPCSELHYDGREDDAERAQKPGRELVNMDDPRVIELWNLVFIQFERVEGGSLRSLPAKHVDTGMGLERIVRTVQGKQSNYDTDLFTPLFAAIQRLTGARAYAGKLGTEDEGGVDEAYRVIADHARTLTFALTDGAAPGNEGRSYVLRRILRRAVRYGRQKLNAEEGFLSKLVPVVVNSMGEVFPELNRDPKRVVEIVRDEEASFGRTLDRGIKMFEDFAEGSQVISGADAFQLYDTYGFPLDLTELMASERGLTVDVAGYHAAMEEQRERSKAGGKKAGGDQLVLGPAETARLARLNVRPTMDDDKHHGRDIHATVKAIWNGANFDEHATPTTTRRIGVLFDKTNFYAEAGGQVADTGRVMVTRSTGSDHTKGGEFKVEDVRSFGGFVLHIGRVTRGELRVGDQVRLDIDATKRDRTRANHTMTHVLNLALRDVLDGPVDQKGSLVDEEKLRFDFSHNGPVTPEELAQVEDRVRAVIGENLEVHADLAPLESAKKISTLRAVFGERYPDPVRVVSVGASVEELLADPESDKWAPLSVEFCGGTHLHATGEAGAFAITSEEGVAKGVRRITALTGPAAQAAMAAADRLDESLATAGTLTGVKLAAEASEIQSELEVLTLPAVRKTKIREGLAALQDRIKAAKKGEAKKRAAEAAAAAASIAESASLSSEPVVIATIETGGDRKALESAMNTIRQKVPTKPVLLLSPDEDEGKVTVMAGVPQNAISLGLKAGDWVREVVGVLGGKGGGRPDAAQGAGTDLAKIGEATKLGRQVALRAMS